MKTGWIWGFPLLSHSFPKGIWTFGGPRSSEQAIEAYVERDLAAAGPDAAAPKQAGA